MPRDASGEAAGGGAPPAAPLPQKGGGFTIPKLAPGPLAADPSAPAKASEAACSAGGGARADAAREDRKDRKHKGTRKHKHLLVVDLNGLLVDRRMAPFVEPDGTKRAPDAAFGKFLIYNRPHMSEFVAWAFEHFTVGVWSSAQQHNAKTLVSHIWGEHRDKLAFVWGQDKCTHVGAMDPAKPRSKPILLKDLRKLWAVPSFKRFGPRNTLLLDDSPYKAAMNPEYCAIHPKAYELGTEELDGRRTPSSDDVLGPGGALRAYLARLAENADFVDAFVEASPWRRCGEEAPASPREIMRKAREGGRAVAAAEAAARVAGVDANEIDLPEDEDEEEEATEGDPRRDLDAKDLDEKDLDASGERRRNGAAAEAPDDLDDPDDPDDPDGWGGSGDEGDQLGVADPLETDPLETARVRARKPDDAEPDKKEKKKPRRVFDGSGACLFLKRWAWKREAKSDEERFELPYEHEMTTRVGSRIPMGFDADDGDSSTRVVTLTFKQARFDDARNAGADGGFASTVWDSAIVLAKFIEKHQETFRGLRVCELGAGCGLVSVAMLHAGASRVVATDLESNTPLLFSNVSRNAPRGAEVGKEWDVKALTWGADAAEALDYEPFDLVVATDCMYVPESATALADTLEALVFGGLTKRRRDDDGLTKTSRAPFGAPVLFSYGRNRQAESAFEAACVSKSRAVRFVPSDVPEEELDELYQCSDVRVVRYRAEASD